MPENVSGLQETSGSWNHWRCPICGTIDGPISNRNCDVCAQEGITERVREYAEPATQRGVVGAEQLARRFHEAYERLAPDFGYETRDESAVPWEQVPEQNRRLMVAVCAELLRGAGSRS